MDKDNIGNLIRADLHRYGGRVDNLALFRHLISNPSFQYCFWFRLRRSNSAIVRVVAKSCHRFMSLKYGLRIPWQTQIGGGLYLGHHMNVVINPTAIIGNNCNLSQFTTIGSSRGKAAVIGDNVFIGPGVSIVESVSVGHDAVIGAGSVVVKDVPAKSTVAGNPARVISSKPSSEFIRFPWPGA